MKKNENHRRGSLKGFGILLLMCVLMGIFLLWRGGFLFSDASKFLKIELEEVSRHPLTEPVEVRMVGAGLSVWNHKNIDFLDASGKSLNDRPVLLEKPIITYGKNHVYLFDDNGKELYILNEKGDNTETIPTEESLSSAQELEESVGYITRNRLGETLVISNLNGNELFRKEASKKHFGAVTMSKDAKYFGYSTFYFSGGEIISSFNIEDAEGKEYLRHGFSGDVVLSAKLFDEGRYCYLTRSGLFFGVLSEGGVETEKNVFSQFSSPEEGKKIAPITVSYRDTLGLLTTQNFYEFSPEGKLLWVYPFVGKYDSVAPIRKGFLLSGESGVLIIEDGKMLLQKDGEILSASSNESMLVIQTATDVQWYRMKYVRKRAH